MITYKGCDVKETAVGEAFAAAFQYIDIPN